MELKCRCGDQCLTLPDAKKNFKNLFKPCKSCEDFHIRKFTPLSKQVDLKSIDADFKRCKCGRRHLDVVMAHTLKIMIEKGIKDENSTLRNVCTPLITPGLPLNSAPHLFNNSVVILTNEMDDICAERIINEIPEVKGVLKGSIRDTVGIKDSKTPSHTYKLMAGCDLRCDLIYTPWDSLYIYKYQGQVHFEFPKPFSPKIKALKDVLDKYDDPRVMDCTCGPGTLGIAALKAGASEVVFNDLWYPAVETTLMNLELNGFPVEITGAKEGLVGFGDNFKVSCVDVRVLKTTFASKYEICLIDVFPGVDCASFVRSLQGICNEMVII